MGGSAGLRAPALAPSVLGGGRRLGPGAAVRLSPALAPGVLPARTARAPASAYVSGVTPTLSGVAVGDGAFPTSAGRPAQVSSQPAAAAGSGRQAGPRSSTAGVVRPSTTVGGVTDVTRPTAIVGGGVNAGLPSTSSGSTLPSLPAAASVSSSSQFGTVPGTNIPVVPSTSSADLMQTAGSGSLSASSSVPVDQDGLVSYGRPADAPVVLPPSPPPRLTFGADSSRITGAGSDDPANSAGNNNPFGVDRSRAAGVTPFPALPSRVSSLFVTTY